MTAPDPAAELREAAGHMRREDPAQFGPEFWSALAGLLDAEADHIGQSGLWLPDAANPRILAIARSYLGTGEER